MNRNLWVAVVVVIVAAVGFYLYKRAAEPPLPDLAPVGATLIEGLGDYSMPVTAKDADVQRWFDQGLAMTYGFNHDAAERSFLKAAELDPDCAMCWWGAALVLGPHVNAGMDPANNPRPGIGSSAPGARPRARRHRKNPSSGRSRRAMRSSLRRTAGRSTRPMPSRCASFRPSTRMTWTRRRCTPNP
jgi:hypothetical protein